MGVIDITHTVPTDKLMLSGSPDVCFPVLKYDRHFHFFNRSPWYHCTNIALFTHCHTIFCIIITPDTVLHFGFDWVALASQSIDTGRKAHVAVQMKCCLRGKHSTILEVLQDFTLSGVWFVFHDVALLK